MLRTTVIVWWNLHSVNEKTQDLNWSDTLYSWIIIINIVKCESSLNEYTGLWNTYQNPNKVFFCRLVYGKAKEPEQLLKEDFEKKE